VVIEDLVSTGGSSMKAIDALRKADLKVLGMISIFSYSFKQAVDLFDKNRVIYSSLSNYETLMEVALDHGYIKNNEVDQLKAWRMAPDQWG
jgi:orotate phosphoribosyltransferase